MWKLKIKPDWSSEPFNLFAEDFNIEDFPTLFWVSGIRKECRSTSVVLPEDEAFKELAGLDPLYLPIQALVYAGWIEEKGEVQLFPKEVVESE